MYINPWTLRYHILLIPQSNRYYGGDNSGMNPKNEYRKTSLYRRIMKMYFVYINICQGKYYVWKATLVEAILYTNKSRFIVARLK